MSRDTQHEAVIEAAARALHGAWVEEGRGFNPDFDAMPKSVQAMFRQHGKIAYDAARSGGAEGDGSRAWWLISAIVREAEHDDACSTPDGWRDTPLARAIATANRQRNDLVRVFAEHPQPRQAQGYSDTDVMRIIAFALRLGWTEGRKGEAIDHILQRQNEVIDGALHAALAEHPEPRRYSAEPDGREAVSAADLAQAIDGVPPEPRQDQPVDRASGEPTPMRERCGATFKCRYSNAEYVQPCDRCPYSDVGPQDGGERQRVLEILREAGTAEVEVARLREALRANQADAETGDTDAHKACRLIAVRCRAVLAPSPDDRGGERCSTCNGSHWLNASKLLDGEPSTIPCHDCNADASKPLGHVAADQSRETP